MKPENEAGGEKKMVHCHGNPKNCSSSIAVSPMSRFSMHPWAESIAGQIGKAVKPEKRGRR
ncbi:hypothetical protein [Mesorhizobium sp. M1365]